MSKEANSESKAAKSESIEEATLSAEMQLDDASSDGELPEGSSLAPFLVGIGASAGGLEALEHFFRRTPDKTGLAYVVIQHLSPDFDSLMDKLLARETNLPIKVIQDGVAVESDTIYLLPPGKEVIISSGRLLLATRGRSSDLSFPIDNFFRSLAQDYGNRSIAVVLSGTGSDGSRGIRNIHSAGGLVIAQSEASAKFDGMPRAACDTGIVDLLLAAEEIPNALIRYMSSPLIKKKIAAKQILQPMEGPVYEILSLLKGRYKIDFTDYKTTTISRRIERRIMLSGSSDLDSYAERLRQDPTELDSLYKDLLIGVTGFFRDRNVFDYLESDAIPELIANLEPTTEFRAWVVGTATGEEAFSLAILLHEAIERTEWPGTFKIFASDVHPESLDFASHGVYPAESVAGLTEERLARYFVENNGSYQVLPELRRTVVFVPHNAIRDAPFTNLDLVTCRNVFIYFTPSTQKKVLSLFHFGLKTGGMLCLGSSETPGELADEFEPLSESLRVYRKRRDVQLPSSLRMPVAPMVPTSTNRQRATGALSTAVSARDLLATYDGLLDEFMPDGFLISDTGELLHAFGNSSQYLRNRNGRPSLELLDLIDPGLRNTLSAGLRRSIKDQTSVSYSGVHCEESDNEEELRLTVRPLQGTSHRLIVSIEPTGAPKSLPAVETLELPAAQFTSGEFDALERELQETKLRLVATVEDSQTTTEELQAANEQLTASNEELQSTNEELHSVNEELYTVNAEYQRKIDELTELTDDMDNLLNSTNVHTIFLDCDLCIRRFTPGIRKTFNLIPQDIGRRFDSFTYNIDYEDLPEDVQAVINDGKRRDKEVQDRAGNWYLLRVLPYVSQGKTDGAVITLVDITSLKHAEARLAELSEIVQYSQDSVFRCEIDGTVRTWNNGAERLFGLTSTEIVGRHVSLLDLSRTRQEIDKTFERIRNRESIERLHLTPKSHDGSIVHASLTWSPITNEVGEVVGASAIARDITTEKRAEAEVREAVKRRDQFMAMLSHELRNPLAAVLNATTLLNENAIDEETRSEANSVIEHNVRHVARMLDDLLDVARITNDKINLHKEVIDLTVLMVDVVECVQHRLDEKHQELHLIKPDTPIYVDGDVGRLQQAQVNLLVNASKYTPDGGRIEFSLCTESNEAIITVSDNGEGINTELLQRIFEPFIQSDETLDRSQGGMGLGLTVVTKVVEGHEGTVSVESAGPGEGSKFTLHLPLTNKRPRRIVKQPDSKTENSIQGAQLMVVEDNDSVRRMLVRAMKLKGFEVREAANGQDALDLLEGFTPDVAVVDIGLPDLDGYELARRIRHESRFRGLMLVALTGYGRDRDKRRAAEAGFDLHLVKPLDPNELVRAMSAAHTAASSQAT